MHLIVQYNLDPKGSRTIFVIVDEGGDVLSIKKAIHLKTGVDIDKFIILHQETILTDETKIADTNLESGDTITIVASVPGGI